MIACDHWRTRRDNMRAIGLTIDGLRAIQRSGASSILDRAFAGFAALPSGIVMPTPWRSTLGLGDDCTLEDVKAAFRELARQHHPDRGGDPKTMQRINAAREAAEQELGHG